MNIELFAAFCLAATVLILMPGPIVTLVIANSLGHGTRIGLATVAGSSTGNALLVGVAAAGLTTVMVVLADLFDVIRVAGAVYLVWLGIKAWRASGAAQDGDTAMAAPARRKSTVFLQGVMIAVTNPKTILFYIAFLPQFLDASLPLGPQLVAMSIAMVLIATLFDSMYAVLAGRARRWFADPRRQRWQARITGSLLIVTGLGLLLARRA